MQSLLGCPLEQNHVSGLATLAGNDLKIDLNKDLMGFNSLTLHSLLIRVYLFLFCFAVVVS